MKSAEIRQAFLDFFASNGHQVVDSSPLVPGNDPTLLFTNAGMVQFKDVFLGTDKRGYKRATSSQRCVRAGGKHNDLDNVGYTARHHTFFEMLGNFSFGDYFKHDAIRFGWEFLTKVMNLPEERLWVTVYEEDDEAADIWLKEMGVSPDRFSRLGAKDNFWSMGDTGPCGPCTEIFYDHGADVPGGPPGSPDDDLDRYIEIWNLVFMQFDRAADGSMTPLPKPSVDTGMGLERIAAIMQGVHSNYEIDLFQALLKAVAEVTGCTDMDNKSLRVIADHIRSCAFLVVDGVLPSNEGRGYVLRRIIRRAIRHGHQLGAKDIFFYKIVDALAKEMGEAYPELVKLQAQVEKVLRAEEEQFVKTLDKGMKILDAAIAELDSKVIPGETVFKLYDTYGFPADLTADVAREKGLSIDQEGFDKAMEAQRETARASSNFGLKAGEDLGLEGETEFTGYDRLEDQAKVVALFKDGVAIDELVSGDQGIVVLDSTPFYGESGGQAGDKGLLKSPEGEFTVSDTTKDGKNHLHHGEISSGAIKVGDYLNTLVDHDKRDTTRINHSATHLLHSALRQVLGDHVQQKGSLVTSDRLRFDFSHFEGMTAAEVQQAEDLVNEHIRANTPITTELMAIDDAREKGAMALFGEKYDDEVRVLSMGSDDFSVELCGGTHAKATGDIGLLKVVSEGGIAAGIRRVEAVVGSFALAHVATAEAQLGQIAGLVKGNRDTAAAKVEQLVTRSRQLEKEIERLKSKLASSAGSDLASKAIDINGTKVLAELLEGADTKTLRNTMDQLKNKLGSAVIVLATADGDKVTVLAGVTKDRIGKVKAGDLVNMVAEQVGGRGGGKPEMAQAGGKDASALPTALASVKPWSAERL